MTTRDELLALADDIGTLGESSLHEADILTRAEEALRLSSRQEVSVEELARQLVELHGNPNTTHFDDARTLLTKYSITNRTGKSRP